MKKVYFTITLIVSMSCSSPKPTTTVICNENLIFKKAFFEEIDNVEKLITTSQGRSFRYSLLFISKYAKVSFDDMLNYNNLYPLGSLEKDKKVWLNWYEKNKCSNIQFK